MRVASLLGGKAGEDGGPMISAVASRQHAVEYHQMSELRAPSLRVRDILIDMARNWERLALETDHARRQVRKLC